jgi:hypothetical protein
MVLEQKVKDILREEYDRIKKIIPYDGMFDSMAKRIVKEIKEEIVR